MDRVTVIDLNLFTILANGNNLTGDIRNELQTLAILKLAQNPIPKCPRIQRINKHNLRILSHKIIHPQQLKRLQRPQTHNHFFRITNNNSFVMSLYYLIDRFCMLNVFMYQNVIFVCWRCACICWKSPYFYMPVYEACYCVFVGCVVQYVGYWHVFAGQGYDLWF